MEKTTLVFALLLTTTALWQIALITPGWFVFSDRTSGYTSEVHASVFYITVCTNQKCAYTSYYGNDYRSLLAYVSEFQIETSLAFVLYGISCILVMLPDSCSCNKKCILSVVTIILTIAETTALVVIFRMCAVNAFASIMFASRDVFIHFPYSVFFAGLSLVVGIIALIFSYVALRSLINRDTVNDQYFGLAAGDQHVYNQVPEDNLRRPNEADEDHPQETNKIATNYQHLGLTPEEQDYSQVPEDNLRRPNEADEDHPRETNKMATNYQHLGLTPEEHDYNQVPEDNLRRPNEANEDLHQETNKMATNYQHLGVTPEEHDYNQVLEDNLRRPNEANEDLHQEVNKIA